MRRKAPSYAAARTACNSAVGPRRPTRWQTSPQARRYPAPRLTGIGSGGRWPAVTWPAPIWAIGLSGPATPSIGPGIPVGATPRLKTRPDGKNAESGPGAGSIHGSSGPVVGLAAGRGPVRTERGEGAGRLFWSRKSPRCSLINSWKR